MEQNELIYWRLFLKLEEELGYKLSIRKYKLFCIAMTKGHVAYEEDYDSFLRFCKILLLQNHKHEARFEEIVKEALDGELITKLQTALKDKESVDNSSKEPIDSKPILSKENLESEEEQDPKPTKAPEKKPKTKEKKKKEREIVKYFHPQFDLSTENLSKPERVKAEGNKYILSNHYLPFTTRQMEKGWQYFRRKEISGFTNEMDLPKTIESIAKEGFFLKPTFLPDKKNKQDTLVIFADFQGSMVPFHQLIRELITTAREGGQHSKVAVYYFSNLPMKSVFLKPNLSKAVKLEQVFTECNSNFTKAIIISDAGASRKNHEEESIEKRVEATKRFLTRLNAVVAKTIWINPMPAHRWQKTPAEKISGMVSMIPVLEADGQFFLKAFKELS